MRSRNLHAKSKRNIRFQLRNMASAKGESEDTLDELLKNKVRIEELPDDDDDDDFEDVPEHASDEIYGPPFPGKTTSTQKPQHPLPPWLDPTSLNLFHTNDLVTTTSEARAKTLAECLPLLNGSDTQGLSLNTHSLPHLRRAAHANFLRSSLEPMPAGYVVVDASRPWLFYWALAGLSFLGEDVSSHREVLMQTVKPLQNSTGGFGGGYGQLSHCAGSYATVLALAAVGGLEVVDRAAMWRWLGTVKQRDGGFCMAVGAEEDVRGAYCAMTIITLLNLPLDLPPDAPAREFGLEKFTDGLGEWVGRCQTFEGGIAGAPGNEAHGAYAFCALACLCILDAPQIGIPKYLDVQALARCLANLQTSPEGGFAGRTNKLVDACYSHWVGGCWALLQAALSGTSTGKEGDGVEDLWNREALIRYLLCCCQQPGKKGGMRDKPSTRPDAYHTCYSLAGLSAATNHYSYDRAGKTVDEGSGRLMAAFQWTAREASGKEREQWKVDEVDVVEAVHPVFVLPMEVVERTKRQFERGEL